MFGDVLHSAGADATGVGSLAVTITSPTSGNLLIAMFSRSAVSTWGTDPTGWTAIHQVTDGTGNMSAKWFYKISDGTETSVTAATVGTSGNFGGAYVEIEGPFEASPLDQSAESESNISTIVTSQASGTTGMTSQNDEVAVAVFAADSSANVTTSRTYSNSFIEAIFHLAESGRASAAITTRVLTTTGTYSTTFSCTDTGDEMYGSIATFKKQASGGTSIVPITLAQRRQRA